MGKLSQTIGEQSAPEPLKARGKINLPKPLGKRCIQTSIVLKSPFLMLCCAATVKSKPYVVLRRLFWVTAPKGKNHR